MAFPPAFLDELRNQVSLAELIGRRVRLVRRGREYVGLCPFHNEKTPSFSVVEDKQFFHCFGCGAHGDAIGYTMRADNVDFVEAIERLAGIAGIAVPQSTPQERERAQQQKTLLEAMEAATVFYEQRLWSPFGRAALEYLRARGLDDETIHRFRLGWAPEDRQTLRRALLPEYPEAMLLEAGLTRASDRGRDPYDYFGNRVVFPITDRAGRVIAFGARTMGDDQPKYLNSPDTPLFDKGRTLYGWAAARANIGRDGDFGGYGAIVTEGYMDVIALHRAGFQTAVAPLGTALTEAQLQELWRLSPEPVLCFDGDSAGQRAALRALDRALPLLQTGKSLRFARISQGEDPDSLIRLRGRSAFEQVLAQAIPLSAMIWESEASRSDLRTPEKRAEFRIRLQRNVEKILDPVLRSEYRGYFTDQFYATVRSAWQTKFRKKSPDLEKAIPLPPPPEPIQRVILLILLIRLPQEIYRHQEDITRIEIPEPEYSRVRWELLEASELHQEITPESLHIHLSNSGLGEVVGSLSSRITRHGLSAFFFVEEEIEALLKALLEDHETDMQEALRAWDANPTPENWERLKGLKERELAEPRGDLDALDRKRA